MAEMKKKVIKALNQQLEMEVYSAHIYWAMSAWFETQNLGGFAQWMIAQYGEEMQHARKFYGYLNERGARAVIPKIDAPPAEYDSPLAAFEIAYAHECKVSASIYKVADVAKEAGDWATLEFLGWFFTEQVEEEKTTDDIVQMLKMAGDNTNALFMIDRQLGARQFGG
jgi:ferritin